MSIAHCTTVHPRTDTRIRVKEAASLSETLEDSVILFVQDGEGDEFQNTPPLQIIDTGPRPAGRLGRMTKGAWRMYRAVLKAKPQIAHFHDPELIPIAFALKLSGIRIIYDVHEDVPRQILNKQWLPAWLRHPISWLMEGTESVAARVFDRIVTATPTISARFPSSKTITIKNFPILSELLSSDSTPYRKRPPYFAYIGGITPARGALEMVQAIGQVPDGTAILQLAGEFNPTSSKDEAKNFYGWSRVNFHGWASRRQVAEILGQARAGLVVLHPTANYPDAYPVKMFEYMAAGLPVIASDFPLWRKIVEDAECGLLVDPMNPAEIASAMQWLLDHPDQAETMGKCGRQAVETIYNWEAESQKLIYFYCQLSNRSKIKEQ